METGQFLMDVLDEGGLDDNGSGRRTIQRVRLMHGAIRNLILGHARTRPEIWQSDDTPINQEDLAGTLLAFSYVVAEPMKRLGVTVPAADAEAYLHTWNVIGHLLGLDDDMLVRDLDDATDLVTAIRDRHFAPSVEGAYMTKKLIELLDDMTPGGMFDRFIPQLVRHLVGDEVADMIRVPKFNGRIGWAEHIVGGLVGSVIGGVDDLVDRVDLLKSLSEPFGKVALRTLMAFERQGDRAAFNIPGRLATRWEL